MVSPFYLILYFMLTRTHAWSASVGFLEVRLRILLEEREPAGSYYSRELAESGGQNGGLLLPDLTQSSLLYRGKN